MDIWKKKIVLYGDLNIQKDLQYLFKGLEIQNKESQEDDLTIVCEKQKDEAFEIAAQKAGMEYGKSYLYVEDFFFYYNPIFLERRDRKLAVWGTGASAGELWNVLNQRGIASEIDFYIDNKRDKTVFKGKPVLSPMEIRERKDLYIIVASCVYQWEIYEQLEQYGFHVKTDYIHYHAVLMDYQELLKKVCFADTRYRHVCHRPFGYCDVIEGNLYLCCPDFLPVPAGNMRFEPFLSCWNSYTAHILRLSIHNGTFVFCNKQYCDLFDFKQPVERGEEEGEKSDLMPSPCPNTLMVGTDYSCNLRCPSCREKVCIADNETRKELYRQAEDLLEHVVPYVHRLWMAGNGEVFFSPVYKKMLKDERCQKRSSISVLSNGTLLNQENWKWLKKAYPFMEVVISMDGIRDETIERLRRGADAKKLKDNLEFLGRMRKDKRISRLFLSCVLQAANIAEIYELLEYAKDIGVDKVQFLKLKNNGVYTDDHEFDQMSIFDADGCLKEEYQYHFTERLLNHPLADWFNNAKVLNVKKRKRLDEYDTF